MQEADNPADLELHALLDRSRADDAAAMRSRERWLRHQTAEDASFAGLLAGLSQRGIAASVQTTTGRTHQGVVTAVGRDFCSLRTSGGADVHIASRAVAVVRPQPGFRLPPAGDAASSARGTDLTFAELLARAAEQRPHVRITVEGGLASGELEAVGADVVSLRPDDAERCYVSLPSVIEVSFFPSR